MSFGVGVGDIIRVTELAISIYRDYYTVARGAPQEFQLLLSEVSNLSNALKILQDDLTDQNSILVRAGDDRVEMACEIVSRVDVTLKELKKVVKKYEIIGDASKRKRIWEKFKWSFEFKRIDSLRGKLVYHNAIMNLLLTSIGNSSLDRIESSNRALQTDIVEIKGYIQASSLGKHVNQSSNPLAISAIEDEFFKVSLSAALMKNAETVQPWATIGVDRWIQAGKWWLLKAQMELHSAALPNKAVSDSGYTDLIKASWILIDVVACHPQLSFLDSSTLHGMQLLSKEIKHEFQRINTLDLVVPDLSELEKQNLQIWEREAQARGALLQPGRRSNRSDASGAGGRLWEVGGERIHFHRFGFFQRSDLAESDPNIAELYDTRSDVAQYEATEPERRRDSGDLAKSVNIAQLPCVVLFLVNETTKVARIIAQDQTGAALMEVTIRSSTEARVKDNSILIDAETITFAAPKDAKFLCSIIATTQFYFFDLECQNVNLDDFCCFILIFAVRRNCQDEVRPLMEHVSSSSCSQNKNFSRNAETVALTLASEFINNKLGVEPESGSDGDGLGILDWATRFGHAKLVLLVLELRGDINRPFDDRSGKDPTGLPPMCLAAKHGQEPLVQLLIGNGADMSKTTTALHEAAFNGHEEIVRLLIKKGADVASRDEKGWTALHGAAYQAHVATVRLLLEMRADVAVQDNKGQTPLHLAAGHGASLERVAMPDTHQDSILSSLQFEQDRIDVIRLLHEHGADIAAVDNDRRTPLHLAVTNEHETVALLLIEKGADSAIWKERSKRRMMIHIAAQQGYEKVVRVLLEMGRDVNEADDAKRTPLHLAAKHGHLATARLLLGKGADIEARDDVHWTPLHSAAYSGHPKIVNLLLENGANISARSKRSQLTPLHCAISTSWMKPVAGYEAVVRLLLNNGADTEVRDTENKIPLHWAAELGEAGLARILLDYEADIEAQDYTGSTPFHLAAYSGYEAPSSYKETPYWEHETPFHWTSNRQEAVVRLLRENGANFAVQDSTGRTPLVMMQWCAYYIPILYAECRPDSPSSSSSA